MTSVDLKRLLAYSTIDILGLVLIGVGCAGALAATGHPGTARLALMVRYCSLCRTPLQGLSFPRCGERSSAPPVRATLINSAG